MGLFDDILKKPQDTTLSEPTGQGGTTSGTGGNPTTDDTSITGTPEFLIQKTEEKSLFDALPQDTASTEVIEETPIVHAEEGSLTVLVNAEESASMVSPSLETPLQTPTESTEAKMDTTPAEAVFSFASDSDNNGTGFFSQAHTAEEKKEEKILHPKDFIEKSLKNIDAMIVDIDAAHEEKINEAAGYGKEKEHFASLETNAYNEASALDEEKSQALHVRELLQKELGTEEEDNNLFDFPQVSKAETEEATDSSEESIIPKEESIIGGSVETTLTNLAVKNTVTETIESKVEESPVIASETDSLLISEEKKEEAKAESPIPSIV